MIGKRFRHFKGNEYIVRFLGKDSETAEDVVVYQSVKDNQVWVRPLRMWDEIVDDNGTKRFTLLEDNL